MYTTIGYIGTHQFILDRTQKGHVRTLDENVIKHRSTVYYMISKRQIIYSEWFRRRSNVISNYIFVELCAMKIDAQLIIFKFTT